MGFRVRKVEIGYEHFVSIENDLGEDGLTGESIGDAFAVVINQTISIENEVIENREWGFREDDGGDSFDILVGLVAELGDLFVVIDARRIDSRAGRDRELRRCRLRNENNRQNRASHYSDDEYGQR